MNSTDKDYDDLTRIPGIKNKRQQLLRQSLNVHTFLDLANLPAVHPAARGGRAMPMGPVRGTFRGA